MNPKTKVFGWALNNLGFVVMSRGDLAQAEEYYRRALSIWETR